jgi:fucose permease
LTVVLVIDFGNEAVLAGWIAPYTLAVMPGASATVMVGLYWGGLAAGRVAMPLVLARISKLVLLGLASTTTALGFAAVSVAPTPLLLALFVLGTGLALSPVAPTTLSVAGDRYERNTGTVFGLLLSIGQLGGMVLPWSVARVASGAGFRSGMLVSCGCGIVMALLTWSLAARVRRARPPAGTSR